MTTQTKPTRHDLVSKLNELDNLLMWVEDEMMDDVEAAGLSTQDTDAFWVAHVTLDRSVLPSVLGLLLSRKS